MASLLRENVAFDKTRARIGLWKNWSLILEELPSFGKVLAITRNSHAVLGKIGFYPGALCAPCGHCGCGADGSLEWNFSTWDHAEVTVESRDGRWLYAVEWREASREVLHKICLTADSCFPAFQDWVEAHQAPPQAGSGFSPRRSGFGESGFADDDTIMLRPEAVAAALQRAVAERRAMRVVVGNDGAVQGCDMQPTMFQENGQWIFTGDEAVGLHLRTGQLAEASIRELPGGLRLLKAYESEGQVACVLAPTQDTPAEIWDAEIEYLVRDFALHSYED